MAIRKREGRAKPWQVYWNNPWSKKRESKNFATEEEAREFDAQIRQRLNFGKAPKKKEVPKVSEFGQATGITLRAVHLEYLKIKQFSKASLAWQMYGMRYPLQELGDKDVSSISKADIAQLMNDSLTRGDIKLATVRNRFSVFRTVLRWATDQGYRGPVEFPRLPPANYTKFVPPTPEELAAIFEIASPHIKRVIILGAQCGVRVGPSELLQLTWEDVDLPRRVLRVHGSKKNVEAQWREVPIREDLLPVFEEWRREDMAVGMTHLIHYNGKPLKCIDIAFKRTVQKAGITRRIRPYDLRHAFATECIAAGIDVGTVASLMGHSSPTMIFKHYQYVLSGQKRAAVEALPGIVRPQ